jgi:hypothetical protein
MNIPIQRYLIPGLVAACGAAALVAIFAAHLPDAESGTRQDSAGAIQAPGAVAQDEGIPTLPEVVAKHLFVSQRKATGQNSFSDLVVKGVFLGAEKSVVLSLKSRPQANLRVCIGEVDSVLSQIVDPRDSRQTIATFLREWSLKDVTPTGIVVQHFITGETEIYAVNYTPSKKVKDDAERGYGQGIIPQDGGGEGATTAVAKTTAPSSSGKTSSSSSSGGAPVSMMADRISEVMKRMSPDDQKQLLQKINQNSSKSNQKSNSSSGSSSKNSSSSKSKKN